MKVFADTSFFVALLHGKDKHHFSAQQFYQSFQGNITTSYWVIVEVCNFFSKGNARALAVDFLHVLNATSDLVVMPLTMQIYEEGARLFSDRVDKDWSMTDCISMVIAKQAAINDVLTTDHHFAQAGFNVLMGRDLSQ